MTAQEITKYLSSVFDVELNVYIQEQTLLRMNNTYNQLGKKRNISRPVQKTAESNTVFIMSASGIIIGIITGIIFAIIEYNKISGFFYRIFRTAIAFVAYGIIGLIAGGFIAGFIISLILKFSKQRKLDKEYDLQMQEYRKKIAIDEKRVKSELNQKALLNNEIERMSDSLNRSKNNLRTIYNYNIINQDYQNIYAVGSMYDYFVKGRTQSLGFNSTTGDQGAYNIYENERRMNLIITNTEEILKRIDTVIQNQYELANGLCEAKNQINNLCAGINKFMTSTENHLNQITECQRITAYNAERSRKELEFITWMQLLN